MDARASCHRAMREMPGGRRAAYYGHDSLVEVERRRHLAPGSDRRWRPAARGPARQWWSPSVAGGGSTALTECSPERSIVRNRAWVTRHYTIWLTVASGWNTGVHDQPGSSSDHLGEALRWACGDPRLGSILQSGHSTPSVVRRAASPRRGAAEAATTPTATGYVDLICSRGPMILGHAHPAVVEAKH